MENSEDPTPLTDQVYQGCTQRETKVDLQAGSVQKRVVQEGVMTTRGADEKDQMKEIFSLQKITAWSCDTEGHAEQCFERYHEFGQKDVSTLQQVATPCMDDHQIPLEDYETTGELSAVCAQIVLKCLSVARIGQPDLLWSVITLARSVT